MPERLSSFFILLGGTLAVIALWVISVMAVNWDTRRRMITELERKAWVAVAIVLPLFGFALYLSMRVLRRYLTPQQPQPQENERMTYVRPRQDYQPVGNPPAQQPAWSGVGGNNRPRSEPSAPRTPATVVAAYQPAVAAYALVVLEGPHLGQQFILNHLPARIGRGPEAVIPLDADLNVSRRHAEIYAWDGVLRVRDLQSSHGTLVNGVRVSDQPVNPGDRIGVGGTVFILREAQGR